MKATGIVRRIDDLGRVVIPKEIRRTMRIREGDPLEIYTDREGEVIFKKYSPIGEMNVFASQYAETLYKTCDLAIIICDRDTIISVAGVSKKELMDKTVSKSLEGIMMGRGIYRYAGGERLYPTAEGGEIYINCAMPIVSAGDVVGCVASLKGMEKKHEEMDEDTETKLVSAAAAFLGRQMEG